MMTLRKSALLKKIWFHGSVLCALVFLILFCSNAFAGSYMFVSAGSMERITHPSGYNGTGGTITVTVGIDPDSAYASEMLTPIKNIINTINRLHATTENLFRSGNNNIPSGYYDFESVALHEMGHALGLGHPNLASESGVGGSDTNYTKSTVGADDEYNLDNGLDATRGSDDDIRGDDANLNWFKVSDNDPFTIADIVDSTTYSRDTGDLPSGHTFAANADRSVGTLLGYPNTEAVMQQGTYGDEAQRTLGAEDVAALQYGMAGIDEIAGTGDDYRFRLSYVGITADADIVIGFDNSRASFALTSVGGSYIGTNHYAISSAEIYFNDSYNWYFNDVPNVVCNDPVLMLLLGE